MVPVKNDTAGLCNVCKQPIAHLNMDAWTKHQLKCRRDQSNPIEAARSLAAMHAENEASNAAAGRGKAQTKQDMQKKYKGG